LAYGDRNRFGQETAIARGNVAPFGKGHQGHRRNQKTSPRFRR
jgi:hypothetical protein